jgi:dTDP-4-amino-4,6-dideoxygalactose transaminase
VCHLHGVPADVPAIRNALGDDLPVVEDAAQALGSTLDGALVGLLGVAGVFSFGPQKPVDVHEGGMILARDWDLWTAALQQTGHPVRQLTGGIDVPDMGNLSLRPHPVSAILLATYLRNWDPEQARLDHQQLADELAALPGIRVLGRDPRRRNATHTVPVMIQPGHEAALDCYRAVPSGARDIAALDAGLHTECEVYLVSRRDPAAEHRVNCAD